jgi:hypothetical protein
MTKESASAHPGTTRRVKTETSRSRFPGVAAPAPDHLTQKVVALREQRDAAPVEFADALYRDVCLRVTPGAVNT